MPMFCCGASGSVLIKVKTLLNRWISGGNASICTLPWELVDIKKGRSLIKLIEVISSILEASFEVPWSLLVSVSKKAICPVLVPTSSNLVMGSKVMIVMTESGRMNRLSSSDSPNSLSSVMWTLLSIAAVKKAVISGAWQMDVTSAVCLGRFLILAPLITLKRAVYPLLSPIIILLARLSRANAVISPVVMSE